MQLVGILKQFLISMCIWYSMDDICDKETVKLQLEYIR